jgi:phosphosulfolactate synthase
MNFSLDHIPDRPARPRNTGLTMVMDKGLSIRQVENYLENAGEYVDIAKLGFGTSYMTKNLADKVRIYQEAGVRVYVGGTLFEAFYVRNQLDDFLRFNDKFGIDMIEVSDGSASIRHEEKCEIISRFAKDFTVLSEVGSKEEGILISPAKWIRMMNNELKAGSWKVIAEARESGTVGIFRPNGHAHVILINKILAKVKPEDILWEAPQKSQQVWFIQHMGANVNLGNISSSEVIPLETLRLGLRGDTFFSFLPDEIVQKVKDL